MTNRTVGIDVSARAARTVACEVEWSLGKAVVSAPRQNIDDEGLAQLLSADSPCGIDVPLGWPARFIEAVVAHRAHQPWPEAAMTELVHRATDRWVTTETASSQVRVHPLSVSTDRIGRTALRVAKVMSQVSANWPRTYRAGVVGGVVEVYPAAALARWASRRYRYKGRSRGAAELAALSAELLNRSWLRFESEGCRRLYATDEDNFDALIASLVARAHATGLCEPIPPEHRTEAEVEGWIALPKPGTLDMLPAL